MIKFGRRILGSLDEGLNREWLVTNGLGGFASSSVIGANTRRYHGLLVASETPPVRRFVLVNRLEEEVFVGDRSYALSTNVYLDAVYPKGYTLLEGFSQGHQPTFTYLLGPVRIVKSVFMVHGSNTTIVRYRVVGNTGRLKLIVTPIVSMRDMHELISMGSARFAVTCDSPAGRRCTVERTDKACPKLEIYSDRAPFLPLEERNRWYLNFRYLRDEARGEGFSEDGYAPGKFIIEVENDLTFCIVMTSDQSSAGCDPQDLMGPTAERWTTLSPHRATGDEFYGALFQAADTFITERSSTGGKTIIAGYPWFSDWGRDTMISLPGLTMVTGRIEDAKSILRTYVRHCDRGMLPNRFPDGGADPEYNNVDAAYWLFYGVYKFLQYTGDYDFIRSEVYPALLEIARYTIKGTRYNIRMDEHDGLISAGEQGVQLTWMDAMVEGRVITPRIGKPVEINALWYNALMLLSHLSRRFETPSEGHKWYALAHKIQESFVKKFCKEKGGLYDLINAEGPVDEIRPNQIFAAFLPFSPLGKERCQGVLEEVTAHLYTSLGLRSLSPGDPVYRGQYRGSMVKRDEAYHQGTVWAFLMGPYVSTFVKVHGRNEESMARLDMMFEPFRNHLREYGVGSISEIFEGNPPHIADGCISQAWSVAEILRAYHEDFLGLGPRELADTD